MKPLRALLSFIVFVSCALISAGQQKDPVDYVSPNIGGIGQLLTATAPVVQYPYGMAQLAPITNPGITDRYLADKIYGFPAGPAMLMASVGDIEPDAANYASDYDHDFETSTPYYYAANLQAWGIKAELTATHEAAYYRFTLPASSHAHFVLSMKRDAELTVINRTCVEGSRSFSDTRLSDAGAKTREYFYAEFSRPFARWLTWTGNALSHSAKQAGTSIGFVTDQTADQGEQIEVRVGISYISAEQAHRNLEREIPSWTFEQVKGNARAAWNEALSKLDVTGGTERQRTIFYTALYRSLERMVDITENGRYFSGYDYKVHSAEGHDFYVDDGQWDTFRCLHPLQLLLDPQRQEDMIRSYLRMYEQSGWLPAFPTAAGEQADMIGHHTAQFILDVYEKGYRDFNIKEAYEAMRKNATEASMIPHHRGPLTGIDRMYFDKGFFPALARNEQETEPGVNEERRQAVSVTLENSYDDWCVAQLAKELGQEADYKYFSRLANNYQNVFDPAIEFMTPKSADGKWVDNFNPTLSGGQGGRDYFTEVDAWIYTFNVQHDVAGLIHLLGGRDRFNAKLDRLFNEQYRTPKYKFLSQFPDATGLIGLYAQGNQPSFHIPYLYDFSGQPWKAQKRLRQIMDVWYGDGPLGIPGDEDGGSMSSWYVLSAIGFYPVCPGSPVYEIGSPIFAKSVIRMGSNQQFTIIAEHVSAQNKYIESARLNGKPLKKAWFRHSDLINGGSLILNMGDKPNTAWGSSVQDAPPSMTHEGAESF